MKTLTRTSQQEGSPNRTSCVMCGTYNLGSFEKLCPECKRTQALINASKKESK